ncbi:methionine/alanine import NSS transporter subunit MetS [Corynebacterium sp. ES2794-CONJ1]|uniref:methionine/alanine import NSS transporter subunit MetS n=1 Tax=unclassified Corynebacterium TaxID=2624378 RepID=UPI002168BCCE|nr:MULTISPECIES: methionine/alanine import NSS transporter subunit MetS [unclassified Corynebacterium]MCS4489922.1 methionine/alanine import NSS transporter subunit MetS [Corynebacterium sp. ES2775-CONJ]MCS4491715.1 methionine/alanine import NSS transporter subunit MetS [Corynebacterium sp. ES2715-CONJ3]MCS4531820.1 methionine/alanine import NSS transporter subunit MetS [Corynebacterium sp. ES2730-CONJ]MCU9519216.1 methionine/alanine import NSS transporter subunit MetS [Corynebacterium sp. ES27
MTGIAIFMMVLFMVVIWGGFAATLIHLQRHPDEVSGDFGTAEFATDDVLLAQEIRQDSA